MRILILLGRSLRLRCCLCGQGRLFRNWFSMHPSCSDCGHVYEREPGFFLGSVYINYGLTSLIICTLYPILRFSEIPIVETDIIDRPKLESLGAGEATQGPTSGALANAIFAATGIRARNTPFTPENLRQAAAD